MSGGEQRQCQALTCLMREALGSRRVGRVMHGSVALRVSGRPAALLFSPQRSSSLLRCLQAPLFWILNVFCLVVLFGFFSPYAFSASSKSRLTFSLSPPAAAFLPHSCLFMFFSAHWQLSFFFSFSSPLLAACSASGGMSCLRGETRTLAPCGSDTLAHV